MDSHVRSAATANILFGGVSLIVIAAAALVFRGFGGIQRSVDEPVMGLVVVAMATFHLIVAVPCMVAGYFLTQYRDMARYAMIVISALNLVNLPFGTIIGGYTLWVLLRPETEPLFLHPPRT
jgi:hypothetical protein